MFYTSFSVTVLVAEACKNFTTGSFKRNGKKIHLQRNISREISYKLDPSTITSFFLYPPKVMGSYL